ncbi:MAG: GYD domain-containing protein, partial [Chloroflexi bacterium]|nr:GYD domain-containing protein [Chloroflexota bacterium]
PQRIREVNREVEAFGAKVIAQYAVLGPYDFVNIVEAPDNETIARVSLALGARGTVHIITLPTVSLEALHG